MDELALGALRQDVVDELAGDFPRVRLHRSDALGREGLLHEGPDPRVLRRVFPQKRVDLGLFLGARHRLRALEGRRKRPEIPEDRIAIGPLQESKHADRLNAADRSLGAQLGQQPVALPGETGVADVDSRERVDLAGTGLVAPVATLCCPSDIDRLLATNDPASSHRRRRICSIALAPLHRICPPEPATA